MTAIDTGVVYIGYAPCGCVASVGVAGSETAKDMVQEGLRVEGSLGPVSVGFNQRCPHVPKWGGLPNWEDGTA